MWRLLLILMLLGASWGQNPPRGDLRLVLLSDINGSYGALSYPPAVLSAIERTVNLWQPDLLLSAGDVIAGQSQALPEARFAEMWQAFDRYIAAPLRAANIPYAIAIGNHDGSSLTDRDGNYIFARERAAARAYWQQPMYHANLPYVARDDFPFNYSFTFGELFIVVIDASSARISDAQRAFLARELSRPEAQAARLRLVVGHLPLYGIAEGRNRPGEVIADGEALRQLLERHSVDIYISGHHHAYYPGRRGALKLLNTGGIPARRLLGAATARTAVTVMDIDYLATGAEVRLSTFELGSWRPIALSELPEVIDGLGGSIRRWDLD